ncbi:hypothetical protein LR48_Vigan11g057400 [Vigna angularis]|uniref:Ubiquitin-like protease family profile domain-containing protein n=1 Tax=Phaseolus angularis TaxID=3914 RepID=A0A0L9VR52_PHAAN|nr:hypothetical protein LR48_Vigan11g057400 [Vigna angularis]
MGSALVGVKSLLQKSVREVKLRAFGVARRPRCCKSCGDGFKVYKGSLQELIEICQTPIFTKEDACGSDEEVAEAPEVGDDEEPEVGRDRGFEQQDDGNAVDDPLGAYTEVRGEDKTACEDVIVSRSHDKIVCIEIDDDGDEVQPEAVPLVIPPMRSFAGDPRTTVDVDQLYRAVNVREITVYRVVSEIIGQTLSTTSFYTLAPIKYVDNMAKNMARFFCLLMNRPEGSIAPLTVKQENISSQPNLHDCGVIMLKAMEIWDGDEKYNGKSMPQYTTSVRETWVTTDKPKKELNVDDILRKFVPPSDQPSMSKQPDNQ